MALISILGLLEAILLPFLNKAKMQTGVMVKTRQPDESQEPKEESDLESIVKEAIEAYKANDMKHLSDCIKEAHDLLHKYMDKPESDSSASQNEKAAKENE